MRRPILALAAAAAMVATACSSGTTPSAAPSQAASAAPTSAASAPASASAEAPSEAAASLIPSEYGTISPLKPAVDLSTVGGPGEGELNIIIWGGYAEDGANVPEYDWVEAVHRGHRLQGQYEGRQHLRRDGLARPRRWLRRGERLR